MRVSFGGRAIPSFQSSPSTSTGAGAAAAGPLAPPPSVEGANTTVGAEDPGVDADEAGFASVAERTGLDDMMYYPKNGKGAVKDTRNVAETAREK